MTRLGFAGLGRMGRPMVRNLARAGFEVVVWNRTRSVAEDLAGATGVDVADTPRQMADADVVITMLADDAASAAVHFGEDGAFAGRARTFLEMGTVSPDHIAALAEGAGGRDVIDAPVSGSTPQAEAATLKIMAGCDTATLAPLRPVLEAMGDRIDAMGGRGRAAVMKLAVNMLIHGLNQTLAEALALTDAAGLDRARAFEVIAGSAAGAPMLHYRKPLYLDEAAHDVTFALKLAAKDMQVATELAAKLGISTPQAVANLDQLNAARTAGFAERDMAAIVAYMRGDA